MAILWSGGIFRKSSSIRRSATRQFLAGSWLRNAFPAMDQKGGCLVVEYRLLTKDDGDVLILTSSIEATQLTGHIHFLLTPWMKRGKSHTMAQEETFLVFVDL